MIGSGWGSLWNVPCGPRGFSAPVRRGCIWWYLYDFCCNGLWLWMIYGLWWCVMDYDYGWFMDSDDGLDYDFTFWIGVRWSMIFTGLWPFWKFSQELISPPWTAVFFPTRTFFSLLSARLAQCMASGDWTVFHRNYINLSVYNRIYIYTS